MAGKQDHQGCPGSSPLSWVFKMRAINQLMNYWCFLDQGCRFLASCRTWPPCRWRQMATRAPRSDKQHHWQLQLSAWKTGKGILCHSCCESSIMQPRCIKSWIWVKPELSSYKHQSSNQQCIRKTEEFRINVSDKGNLRSSKQSSAN